ncbi:hypothetical protein HN51_052032 [Arachis hypogaea]|uniref:ER lumen protein retaining receptor n=1 Tax=Arachis hypogaea TaxID=3818 RepID=A0A445CCC3_ARAHY|nr:hypothetical protein Ahy_A07g034631 [Arachis hypogaea]
MRPPKKSIHGVTTWVRRQPPKVKTFLAVVSGMAALVFLRFIVHDHDNLFVAAEAVHSLGISVLIYKLMKEKTCAGYPFPSSSHNLIQLLHRISCFSRHIYELKILLVSSVLFED